MVKTMFYNAMFSYNPIELQFWKHENRAIELFNSKMIESRMSYIHEKPIRAGCVEKEEDCLYPSVRNYAGLNGLIDIDF